MIEIRDAARKDRPSIRRLFHEYAAGLGIDLGFQRFEEELDPLPGSCAPPEGRILIALGEDGAAGCVAMRPQGKDICEMKRLYVRPGHRGQGMGRRLVNRIMEAARRAGYRAMKLDTLPAMIEARALYQALGFRPIPPYYGNPIPGMVYLERDLSGGRQS